MHSGLHLVEGGAHEREDLRGGARCFVRAQLEALTRPRGRRQPQAGEGGVALRDGLELGGETRAPRTRDTADGLAARGQPLVGIVRPAQRGERRGSRSRARDRRVGGWRVGGFCLRSLPWLLLLGQ